MLFASSAVTFSPATLYSCQVSRIGSGKCLYARLQCSDFGLVPVMYSERRHFQCKMCQSAWGMVI